MEYFPQLVCKYVLPKVLYDLVGLAVTLTLDLLTSKSNQVISVANCIVNSVKLTQSINLFGQMCKTT